MFVIVGWKILSHSKIQGDGLSHRSLSLRNGETNIKHQIHIKKYHMLYIFLFALFATAKIFRLAQIIPV